MLKSSLEMKFALEIKGLIIVLSFNHQFMQCEQTVWEDLGWSWQNYWEWESGLRKAASTTPGLNRLREGIPRHVYNIDCDGLNHRDDRLGY